MSWGRQHQQWGYSGPAGFDRCSSPSRHRYRISGVRRAMEQRLWSARCSRPRCGRWTGFESGRWRSHHGRFVPSWIPRTTVFHLSTVWVDSHTPRWWYIADQFSTGGLSYFSAATGFACDNVVNFEVVLASGEIVPANDKNNRNLFIALKGGSNNFGIVTRFDLPTFKQGQMWGGGIYYSPSAYPQLVQAFSDFAASSTPDELQRSHHRGHKLERWRGDGRIEHLLRQTCGRPAGPETLHRGSSTNLQVHTRGLSARLRKWAISL